MDWPDAATVFTDEQGNAIATRQWEAWREGIEDVEIARMLQSAVKKGWLRPGDMPAAKRWLAEIPTKVIDENQKTGGRAVQEARSQALAILDRAWDTRWKPEMLTFSAPAHAKGDDVQP
ncbi:MAG: hypothetical protein HY318_19380 [Armatimonadetes bacterium]|nr:hypothetical protein [Armatimonadota bacterium]